MTGPLEVETSARIHLGFFDLNGGLGRRFGSLGLLLDRPVLRLCATPSPRLAVDGPDADRIGRYAREVADHLGVAPSLSITAESALPAHSGLGSGTQLALAAAALVRLRHGLPLDVRGDAARLDRGARSGVGIGLFETGGVVADGGRSADCDTMGGRLPPIVSRLPFPESWRVILVLDRTRTGMHGPEERAAFADLPPMSDAAVGALCRLALMGALPGLADGDIAGFGAAVTRMQEIVGDHFAPAQGGRFASPAVAARLAALGEAGAAGVGQSSWGPTGFAFAAGEADARRLIAATAAVGAGHLEIIVAGGLNRGARIGAAGRRSATDRAALNG